MKNLALFILAFYMGAFTGTALFAEYQKFKDWGSVDYLDGEGGLAYTANESGIPYVAVSCFKRTRNIVMVNPDFENYAGNRRMLSKVKKASKFLL